MLVRQAANVLELLEYFAEIKRPATLPEISAAMGWPRSSTFNLLMTLEDRGFLYEPRPRAGFYPSTRWNALVQRIEETDLLPDELHRVVDELVEATGETVGVVAPAKTNVVFLHVVESPSVIRYASEVGHQIPIHVAASGHALLIQYAAGERAALLRKLEYGEYPPGIAMSPEEVEAQLKRAVRRGWFQTEGRSTDISGVALPVRLPDRRLSIFVGGPAGRLQKRVPEIARIMREKIERHGFSCDLTLAE